MKIKRFYDIHFHAMDLSHANITSFLNRFISESTDALTPDYIGVKIKEKLGWKRFLVYAVPFGFILKRAMKEIKIYIKKGELLEKSNNVRNLLTFMESSIIYDFLVLDYFLKNGKNPIVTKDNQFSIGELKFNKIVLCPLVMDFGYKNIYNDNIFYNISPQKPIRRQIEDLFDSINTYYTKELNLTTENNIKRFKISDSELTKEQKLFEIYPFMGINTQNYTLEKIKEMLEKYFGDFDGNESSESRQIKLYENIGKFKGDFKDKINCKNIFAGIKVYPPLGFEPWPANQDERKKVEWLYKFCSEKRIPITTHCSTGGFMADPNYKANTNPAGQWSDAIKEYPQLKLNFAHFGSSDDEWRKTIIDLATKEGSSIYTDFSCNTEDDAYYKKLNQLINDNNHLEDKVLFGSDFMINLLWSESYNEYFNYFRNTKHLNDKLKYQFANTNAEKFLFG